MSGSALLHRHTDPRRRYASFASFPRRNAKVDEIDTILTQDITPTLERLRGEKTFYLRWSANKTEEERLQRFCVAFEYSSAEASLSNAGEEFRGLEAEQATLTKAQEEASVSRAVDLEAVDARASRSKGGRS